MIIHADDDVLDAMIPFVRDMHASSGLTDAVRESTVTLADAEKLVLDYVRTHVPDARTAPLCGNSIATDRGFLARDMPELDAHLHYRMVDVSSMKELAKRWFPRVYQSPAAQGARPPRAGRHPREHPRAAYYRAPCSSRRPAPRWTRPRRRRSLGRSCGRRYRGRRTGRLTAPGGTSPAWWV